MCPGLITGTMATGELWGFFLVVAFPYFTHFPRSFAQYFYYKDSEARLKVMFIQAFKYIYCLFVLFVLNSIGILY